jgi:hypothetical protein
MRELYAAELIGSEDCTNRSAWPAVQTWVDRHLALQPSGDASLPPDDHDAAVSVTEESSSDGQRSLVLVQSDDGDPDILWRSEIALGQPDSPLHATIRVRISSAAGSALRPLDYEFGTPAIVRTLLRDCKVYDAGVRTQPRYVEIGSSDIPELISWLADDSRHLPVVVVSRIGISGATTLDARSLAAQLAGIAHIRLLSSRHAAWILTDTIGQELGVWNGAVRVYFPGFSLGDDRYRHRLFLPDRSSNSLITRLRSWFGALSSASTPEHPVYAQLRTDRRKKLQEAVANGDPQFVQEYIESLERSEGAQRIELDELKAQVSSLTSEVSRLAEENEAVKASFAQYAQATSPNQTVPHSYGPDEPLTVAGAMDAAESLANNPFYRSRVSITPQAIAKGRDFSSYKNPGELLRAIQAVLEAGALYHENRLGMTPMEFFNKRGYGYGAQPKPHLKVDESTSPDQCLRIYWEQDPEERRWTLTAIGGHE